MSIATAQNWYYRMKRDHWYISQMPITNRALDKALGTSRSFFNTQDVTDSAWRQLERVIPLIERREIVFMPGSEMLRIDIPPIPPILKKLTTAWTLHARCTCGSNQFLPVMVEREYAACYSCLPPDQYRGFGAVAVRKSLIHKELEKLYIAG